MSTSTGDEQGRSGRPALVLVAGAGKGAKMRKRSRRDWTDRKEAQFLIVLAETCNVSQACREAKVSISSAYQRRRTKAAFRSGWAEAIAVAYQRLELVLLDRAFNGTEKVLKRKDGSEERMREYSNQLGLALLKMHRDSAIEAAEEYEPDDIEELRARLINKFQRLRQRDGDGDEAGAPNAE